MTSASSLRVHAAPEHSATSDAPPGNVDVRPGWQVAFFMFCVVVVWWIVVQYAK